MRFRRLACMLLLAATVAVVIVRLGLRPSTMPLGFEMAGYTNLPPAIAPFWTAQDSQGSVSALNTASPSHILFKVHNRTKSAVPFRPMRYQFADSVPAGVAVPQGPSRHRGGSVDPHLSFPPELEQHMGMTFGPPERDCFTYRILAPGATALIALPRPPFDCTWRPAVAYELPLSRLETLKYVITKRLHIQKVYNVIGAPSGLAYDEWIYGDWITNTVLKRG